MFKTCVIFLLSQQLLTSSIPDNLFLTRIDNTDGKYDGYRLPTTTIPSRYNINLDIPEEALTGGNTSFLGIVNISFQVSEPTNIITIHSLVDIYNLTLTLGGTTSIGVVNYTADTTREIVKILTTSNLSINVNYNLELVYNAILEPINMEGFYRSEYTVNGTKEYLGTTQFQPTNARKVFPCFDEPSFKAVFGLTLQYPSEFTAVANTPSVLINSSTSTRTTAVFQDTPIMSTYLLAFTVSKFNCTQNTAATTASIPFGVCSRVDLVEERSLALDYGPQFMAALESWTAYPYSSTKIGKMDQFAIPDFNAGAMENWGLVTYREYMILYNQNYTSNFYKQRILAVIAHEFAHMWFGNLVTCQWWSYTFLNEGFARYFQYFLLSKIASLESYETDKQFIIEQQQTAFIEDSFSTSASLTSDAWTPAQITNKFDTISYNKGASVLRMVENTVGSAVFQSSLQKYLSNNAFTATTPDILWNTISSEVTPGALPVGLNLSQVVDNWTNMAGYPVISARLNGSNIVLTQKRFLYNSTDSDSTQWYVPITFMTSNGTTTNSPIWLQPNISVILSDFNDTWVIINYNSFGYYRVHYDDNLRDRLISALLNNHQQISDINRAQILDDTFNLARAGQIKYSEAFKLLPYLKYETSYYPWYVTIRALNYLTVRLGTDSVLGDKVTSLMLEHVGDVSANVSQLDFDTLGHVDSLKWQLLWGTACRLGHPKCVSEAKRLFGDLRVNRTSINPNIRDVAYCNALRYSDDINNDWNFLWNRLHTIDQPHETLYILIGLGCTRNKQLLSYYLDQSINSSSIIRIQDLATVWSAVYSSGPVGLEVAFEKFRNNHSDILNYYSAAISVLPGIANRFTTEGQLTQLQNFINEHSANSTVAMTGKKALESAKVNLKWQSSIRSDLEIHFGIVDNKSSGTSFGISIYLLLFALFFVA